MWEYRAGLGMVELRRDFVGYDVEATDGTIGKIDESSYDASCAYLVVDTGFWIFGKRRMIPAGVVERVDVGPKRSSSPSPSQRSRPLPIRGTAPTQRDKYETYYGSHL